MAGILQAIENSSIATIESGGMKWRVRKICSGDLARVGHAALAVAQGMDFNSDTTDAEEKPQEEVMKTISKSSAKQLETMANLKDAVIAAGLIAVGDPVTDEWEKVTPVLDRDKADPVNGTIWVGSVPASVGDELFAEIMSLSTDGGRSLERLRAFRERARNPADHRPDSETVRAAAE